MADEPKVGPNRGNAGKGRPKGSKNKTTIIAKEAIAEAFELMGGTAALVAWADQNDDHRKVFYGTIYPKLLPLQVNGAGEDGEHLHKVTGALSWRQPQ